MHYYNTDLAPTLDDKVPVSDRDNNNRQHLVTFTVGFGVAGTIPLNDMNKDGVIDPPGCAYAENPYFNKPACTVMPAWPNDLSVINAKIDDLWHAAVNGHGQYFNAATPKQLSEALAAITTDISRRQAVGAAAAVSNSGQLSDNSTVYIGRYSTVDMTGRLFAYRISKLNGQVDTSDGAELWEAAEKLRKKATGDRVIFTSNGDGLALDFTTSGLSSLLPAQRRIFGGDAAVFANSIDWLRGRNNIAGLRKRGGQSAGDNVLGDIIHSSPVLVRPAASEQEDNNGDGTIFVGANDGMLHAFNSKNGEERFAFIPSQVHDHLLALADEKYATDPAKPHRYYVDGAMAARRMAYMEAGTRKDTYLLVSGLGRGGKGYFALDVTKADAVNSFAAASSILKWEYPRRSMLTTPADAAEGFIPTVTDCSWHASDKNNPDGDGALYCAAAGGDQKTLAYRDDDLGYSYSTPVITRSYRAMPSTGADSWVVFFGNGYGSKNGHAVLYALDAMSGKLLRKIDTGVGAAIPANGLSSPAAVDVDDDDRTDFLYAGDLYGNLWKFDVRSKNPSDWRIAYEDGNHRPQPLFTTKPPEASPTDPVKIGQAITARPNVMRHCSRPGYMVLFGTGQFLGDGDLQGRWAYQAQNLFAIWDNDGAGKTTDGKEPAVDPSKYLGFWNRENNSFVNTAFPGASLLKQEVIYQGQACENQAKNVHCQEGRVISGNKPSWYNGTSGHVGWYLNLPGSGAINTVTAAMPPPEPDANGNMATISERAVQDMIIRNQAVIVISFIPNNEGCSAGGQSVLHELTACSGEGFSEARLDLGDGQLNDGDYFIIGGNSKATVSGIFMPGKAFNPVFVGGTDGKKGTEIKIMPSSSGNVTSQVEMNGGNRINYWREVGNN
jgi:Tfp pilus tip-associated adhesin PilY1